jgi:multisite-specific tRNA:(cytosine-C5)-methyltransferase
MHRYPGKFAWEISAPKRVVRKSQPFKQFQKFLVGETEVVRIGRQQG